MIKLSKGETRGLAKLLMQTPDDGFVDMFIERRMPQADVLVTITRLTADANLSGTVRRARAKRDKTIIGPRGGHYEA
jgi:hypothetical protein